MWHRDTKWANAIENGVDRLARHRVATNLQFVKSVIFAECNKVKLNKMKCACTQFCLYGVGTWSLYLKACDICSSYQPQAKWGVLRLQLLPDAWWWLENRLFTEANFLYWLKGLFSKSMPSRTCISKFTEIRSKSWGKRSTTRLGEWWTNSRGR